jgi:phage/conjugal plasmid C-4 type zinc finger TraR family protein
VADEIDRAQESEAQFQEDALRAARRGSKVQVLSANRRCFDCDEPIAAERIALVPWAVRCIDCQLEAEAQRTRA